MTPAMEIWWIWTAAAAGLAAIEIVVPGFFIVPFVVGATVAGLLAYKGFGTALQWAAFVGVSGVLSGLSLVIARRIIKKRPPATGPGRLVGMRGPITIAVDNVRGTGHVRLGGELWRALSEKGADIPVGVVVEVAAVDGIRVVVREVKGGT
jgi:membrane protein implicated in regulation of membrane protease activity